MRRIRGFTLLEIMLVLLLLGVTSGLVMLSFPADEKPLARQGERLSHWLYALAERAEREGELWRGVRQRRLAQRRRRRGAG